MKLSKILFCFFMIVCSSQILAQDSYSKKHCQIEKSSNEKEFEGIKKILEEHCIKINEDLNRWPALLTINNFSKKSFLTTFGYQMSFLSMKHKLSNEIYSYKDVNESFKSLMNSYNVFKNKYSFSSLLQAERNKSNEYIIDLILNEEKKSEELIEKNIELLKFALVDEKTFLEYRKELNTLLPALISDEKLNKKLTTFECKLLRISGYETLLNNLITEKKVTCENK